MRNPRRDPWLIIRYRDGQLRNALSQRFERGVQPGVGDANCGLFQQLQLRHSLCNDGVAWNRSDLLWIDLIADRKHELQIFVLRQRSYDSAEDIHLAVQNRPHRGVDNWLSR